MNYFELCENVNVAHINGIENCIQNIQMKDDIEGNLKQIQNILSSEFSKCGGVSIMENTSTVLYGMRVYPSNIKLLGQYVSDPKVSTKELTKIIRRELDSMVYFIEIDSSLLFNKVYNFKPNEITAILLHEIGHVVADTDFYADLKMQFNEALFNMNITTTPEDKIHDEKSSIVGMLYVLSALDKTRLQYNIDNNIQVEQLADKFVFEADYGDALTKALTKFSNIYTKAYKKAKRDSVLKDEAETFVKLNDIFLTRKDYVKTLLDAEKRTNPSSFAKEQLDKVSKFLNKYKRHLNEVNVCVSPSLMGKSDCLSEGFIKDWISKPLKTSQRDIDDLRIEAQMMEDYDDKSILVYKIHKRIDRINNYMESNESSQALTVGKAYIDQLQKLLDDVMKFDARPKRYGVFIKYPKGYEG